MSDTKKKIGLFTCVATGIGAIIGSGIFGSLPAEINEIGDAVVIAFILATIYKLAASFPAVYSSSIIPASGSFFLMPTKLIHPTVGLYMAVQNLLQPVLVSVFAVLFSDYFCSIFTGLKGHETMVSVAILVIYGIMAYMGTYLFASINSLIVVVMMVTVAVYIVLGIPNIDASQLSIGEAFGSGIKISSIGAAVSVFASCLSGGTAVSQIADEVKNPRRDIPLALILAPVIVAFIYILMAVVTLGCMDGDTVTTLSDVAKGFMAPGLVVFFVVGGPLCGVLTSMVPVIMLTCAQIQAAADCGVFPKALAKKNKNGVSTYQRALKEAEEGKAYNNLSPVFTYSIDGGATFMWMGDIESGFIEKVKGDIAWCPVDVLFAPHHGRKSGKLPDDVLKELNPKIIIIGEAPSENIDYYQGYNTLTQNSTGNITLECIGDMIHVFIEADSYAYDTSFLEDKNIADSDHGFYIGTIVV